MNISLREKKIFLYSLLFLVASLILAIFANIWFTFNDSSQTFNIFIAAYSVCFLGFSFLCSTVAGKFLAELKEFDALVALTIYFILALPSNYMFWVLLKLLTKKLPQILLDLIIYTDGHQLFVSVVITLIVLATSSFWFFLAKNAKRPLTLIARLAKMAGFLILIFMS